MHVTRLDIAGLRRFARVELRPAPALNLLVGDNGAGKTSVLEALHLMAYGRSFRGRVELARIKGQAQVGALVQQVLAAPVGPTHAGAEARYCAVVFNLVDRTAVRRIFFPATGELMPGIQAPREFTEAVEGALAAREQTCGGGP